jgi:hypothetical protein
MSALLPDWTIQAMWRSSHFSFWLVDDLILPIFFAAMLILNFWFAPSSWLAAGDYYWPRCLLLIGQQLLVVGQHEWQWLRLRGQLVW